MQGNAILGAAEEAQKRWLEGDRPAIGEFRFEPPRTELLDPDLDLAYLRVELGTVQPMTIDSSVAGRGERGEIEACMDNHREPDRAVTGTGAGNNGADTGRENALGDDDRNSIRHQQSAQVGAAEAAGDSPPASEDAASVSAWAGLKASGVWLYRVK